MKTPSRREWALIALVPVLALTGYYLEQGDSVAPAATGNARPPVRTKAASTTASSSASNATGATLSGTAKASAASASESTPAPTVSLRPGATLADVDFPRLKTLRASEAAADPGEVFAKRSWYVAPPPPPPVVRAPPPPPPAPTAPPLPFTYLGAQREGAQLVIFLVKGNNVLTVKRGDVLEGTYRVEGVEGTKLGLTYLPLNIKQTLEVGPQS